MYVTYLLLVHGRLAVHLLNGYGAVLYVIPRVVVVVVVVVKVRAPLLSSYSYSAG